VGALEGRGALRTLTGVARGGGAIDEVGRQGVVAAGLELQLNEFLIL
jgi:hypothetical protein